MWSRRRWISSTHDDTPEERPLENKQQSPQSSDPHDGKSDTEESSSAPKTDLRIVLLGEDSVNNNYANGTILRHHIRGERINPQKGNTREKIVGGRQVSVFTAPSYWTDHLASYWIFSNGVNSIRHEIQNCTSTLFPGPHAFLLVVRGDQTSGKERYLLRAIAEVFGKEALEYTIVLFIHGNEWELSGMALQDRCVQMCDGRFFLLEDTDEHVKELFRRIDQMTNSKKSSFFIQHSYENLMTTCFESWESRRLQVQMQKENKLLEDLQEMKEMKDEQQLKLTGLQKEVDALKKTEAELRKELDELNRKHLLAREELLHYRLEQEQKKLQAKEQQLCHKEKELMIRESELDNRARAWSQDPVMETTKDELQAAGTTEKEEVKPVRRNSVDLLPPKMLEERHTTFDDL